MLTSSLAWPRRSTTGEHLVINGGSYSGVLTAQYLFEHHIPQLQTKKLYQGVFPQKKLFIDFTQDLKQCLRQAEYCWV